MALVLLLAAGCGTSGPTPSATGTQATPDVTPPIASAPTGSAEPSGSPAAGPAPFDLAVVASGLDGPLDIAWAPGRPDDLFVVEQVGRIRLVRDGAVVEQPFLDIAGLVTAGGEQGLLGLAFDPDPADHRLFVYYTALDGSEVLASYETTDADPDRVDPGSQRILLQMADPASNHNGGSLTFGPDGYLYVGTGDGGGGGDPLGSGRSLDTLLAKVLRLDVNVAGDAAEPYAIPADNPFVDTAGARPEIFLTGLRNPWRIRFDSTTGDLWIGDVGQNQWEEIDVVRAGDSGLDFGWNLMEATHCYEPATGCDRTGLTLPVAEYAHDLGCSVTGGTVYRGTAIADLVGQYVFADYCSGRMWILPATGDEFRELVPALESGRSISAIAAAPDGELYVTDLGGGDVLKVVPPAD
jgi:glucose/arabinose dehydrogenase